MWSQENRTGWRKPVFWLWWHSTDKNWFGLLWPMWRVVCLAQGVHRPHHMDVYFEYCIVCGKLLWSARRHGTPNPIANVEEVPLYWRPEGGK